MISGVCTMLKNVFRVIIFGILGPFKSSLYSSYEFAVYGVLFLL